MLDINNLDEKVQPGINFVILRKIYYDLFFPTKLCNFKLKYILLNKIVSKRIFYLEANISNIVL